MKPETRPCDGFIPNIPQKFAGMRIDPPPSLPRDIGVRRAATAAAPPPVDPPGVRSVSHGLRPYSPSRFSQVPTSANSGTLVLPSGTAPASFTRSTTAQSFSGTWSLNNRDPSVVRTPPVIWESLIAMGSPWSGPNGSPRITAASRLGGALHRVVPRHEQERMDLGIEPVDAFQECLDEFDR